MKILREGLELKFWEMCVDCMKTSDLVLYDLEYLKHQKILRIFIMNPETKTADLDDCIKVDRSLSPFFEENDWIPEDIVLEVSSPGLFRKLRCLDQFEQNVGNIIKVKFRGDIEGIDAKTLKKIASSRSIIGNLESIEVNNDGFDILLKTFYRNDEFDLKIKSIDIVKAQCEPEI